MSYPDNSAPEGTQSYYVTAVNGGGESQPSNTVSVVVDRTAPNVVGAPDSAANSNGWYNHDVTINWSSTDPNPSSGGPTQPSPTVASTEGDNTYTSGQSCDPAGNCAAGSLELKIDKSLPDITYTVTPEPNANGWNKDNVTVTFNCTDGVSGIDSCSAPITVSTEGGNQTVTATATDKAGNTKSIAAVINLDKTAPLISYTLSQSPNTNGWFNSPVTVTYACSDILSDIQSCSAPQTESNDGSYTLSGSAVDRADNQSRALAAVNIDQTAPTISYSVSPAPNANGWNNTDVVVSFTCSDATSGIQSCPNPVTVNTEGGGQSVAGTAVDNAGNTASVTATVNIDKTQPNISYALAPVPNAGGWNNSAVTVTFTCSDNPGGSGIAVCPGPQTESADGTYTLSGTAVDAAGNTATTMVNVNVDQTAPAVSNLVWTSNPVAQSNSTVLSASVSDNLSGVASVYYTVNGGTQQAMTYDSALNVWKASFGSSLVSNTYDIGVFATDAAGNTSPGAMDILVVSSGSATGHARLLPTTSDVLPIALDTGHNPKDVVVGFSSLNNVLNKVSVDYAINNNKNEFTISSSTIDWVVKPDTMHMSMLVHGTLTVYSNNGNTVTTTQNVAMRVDMAVGVPGSLDNASVRVWNPGQNMSSDPVYHIDEPFDNGSTVTIQ